LDHLLARGGSEIKDKGLDGKGDGEAVAALHLGCELDERRLVEGDCALGDLLTGVCIVRDEATLKDKVTDLPVATAMSLLLQEALLHGQRTRADLLAVRVLVDGA